MLTTLTLSLTLLLIALLVAREFLGGLEHPWARRQRLVGRILIPPLTLLFGLSFLVRVGGGVGLGPSAPPQPTTVPAADAASREPTPAPPPTPVRPTPGPRTARPLVDETFARPGGSWLVRSGEGWSADVRDGRYLVTLDGQTSLGVSRALPAGDYRISLDVTLETGGAGAIFLAAEPATFYRLLLTPDRAFAVQVIEEDTQLVTNLIDWTASDALAQSGVRHQLRIERHGDTIAFYANDLPLATLAVPEGRVHNQVGVALASRQGQAAAAFDNLRAEQLLEPESAGGP
jgi:hypothetical protein